MSAAYVQARRGSSNLLDGAKNAIVVNFWIDRRQTYLEN